MTPEQMRLYITLTTRSEAQPVDWQQVNVEGIRWRNQIDAAAEQARRGFGSAGYLGGDNFRLRSLGRSPLP